MKIAITFEPPSGRLTMSSEAGIFQTVGLLLGSAVNALVDARRVGQVDAAVPAFNVRKVDRT